MVVTVILSGFKKRHVDLEELAANLDKMFGTDTEEIGTFRVRLVPRSISKKLLIALDFQSGYDAMYAQNSMHGTEYTMSDGTTIVLHAKVTNIPELMPVRSLTSNIENHIEDEPSSYNIDDETSIPGMKIIHKAGKKMDVDLLEKEEVLLSEQELLKEKERLKRELSQLPNPENSGGKKRRRNDSTERDYEEISLHYKKARLPETKPRNLSKSRKTSVSHEQFPSLPGSGELPEFSPNISCSRYSSRQMSGKVSKSSQKSVCSSKLLEYPENVFSSQKVSENSQYYDHRSREREFFYTPRYRKLSDSSRKTSRGELLEASPNISSSRKSQYDPKSHDYFSPNTLKSKELSDSTQISSKVGKFERSRKISEISQQDPRPRELLQFSSKTSRSRELSDTPQRSSKSGKVSESSQSVWQYSKIDLRSKLDQTRSRNESSSRKRSRSRGRSRSRELLTHKPKYHCSSWENPKDWEYRKFKDGPSRYNDKYHSPDFGHHSRSSSMYHEKYHYNHYEKGPKPSYTKARNIKYRPHKESCDERQFQTRHPLSKHLEDHRQKNTIDDVQKEKEGALTIQMKETETNEKLLSTMTMKETAIKEIIMDSENLFDKLITKYNVKETEKKVLLKKVLSHFFAIINRRMQKQDISNMNSVKDVVTRYRGKYNKMKDSETLEDLFTDFVSTGNDKELDLSSSNTDNIWGVVDQVLGEFDPSLLSEEDVKPKIELPEKKVTPTTELPEQIKTITINLNLNAIPSLTSATETSAAPPENKSQCENNKNKFNIKIDPNKKHKYYIPIKRILQKLKIHVDTYNSYLDFHTFTYVIRGALEKRLDELLLGKPYLKADDVVRLYRDNYPRIEDHDFVLQVLNDVWEGKYSNVDGDTAKDEALTTPVNVKIENVLEETQQMSAPGLKKEKDATTDNKMCTDKKIDTDKNKCSQADIVAAVKTEKNIPESSNDILMKDNGMEPSPTITAEKDDTMIESVSSTTETPRTNDNDVMLVESKIEVIDLSSIGDDLADSTQPLEHYISTNKAVKEEILPDNDIICLTDNEQDFDVIDLEVDCKKAEFNPNAMTNRADVQNQTEQSYLDIHRVYEKGTNIVKEENQSGDEINVGDDTASLDTVILCEDTESNSSFNEPNKAVEEEILHEVNVKNEKSDEKHHSVNITNLSVEITNIPSGRYENDPKFNFDKRTNEKETNSMNGGIISNDIYVSKENFTDEISRTCAARNCDLNDEGIESIESIEHYLQLTSTSKSK